MNYWQRKKEEEKYELELHDKGIPEYWPHLRGNRDERYRKARLLLEEFNRKNMTKVIWEEMRITWIEIIELPEIDLSN